MSAQHGCNDNKAVVESFKEALEQRIGADHFRMWFSHGVRFQFDGAVAAEEASTATVGARPGDRLIVHVRGQFALDRLRNKFMRELRAAAAQACGPRAQVTLELDSVQAVQAQLPLDVAQPEQEQQKEPADRRRRSLGGHRQRGQKPGNTKSLSRLMSETSAVKSSRRSPRAKVASRHSQPSLPNLDRSSHSDSTAERAPGKSSPSAEMTGANFIAGPCNRLAYTAMTMACQAPASASPLFVCGPSGTGKTHLLTAIADQLRRRHRMRRVIHMSAEQFTNDFISSVGNAGIASFRRRYRDVDALLVDDVQFLGAKRATLREMLYTVETLAGAGRTMVFSGNQAPTEIPGLTRELSGRMAAGLLCPMQPLDQVTRETLLRRELAARCQIEVPDAMIQEINPLLAGDGRLIQGVANLINTLQRMHGRMPTMDEIHQFGGELLRAGKPVATLSAIEQAVCQTFQLPDQSLRAASQTRAVSEPRMLAMYLSRQLTSAAFAEIAGHFGRSHSTAIAAGKNVQTWLEDGKSIGRGQAAMTAQQAIDRIESLLRSG